MGRKQKRIAAIDAETDPFKYGREPKPFSWGIYDGEAFTSFWGDNCTEQLIEYLQDEEDLILYAHNGGKFDFFFLLPFLDNDIFIINGRIAKATLFDGKIELRDSWLILPLPLASHGKDEIDYCKMEREVREIHKSEIISYLKTDCLSLYNWVIDFIVEFGLNLTLASTAFKQLKKTSYEVGKTFDSFDSKFRPFYFGGRVQCFEVGAFKEDLQYVDINSAYPHAMKYKHWYGSQFVEHLRLPEKENGSWFAEIEATSKGALPLRHENKLYFPDDNKKRRYLASGWEIMTGLETNTLNIHKVFRSYRPVLTQDFSEYVEKFFKMKLEAEQEGNATKRQFAKLMLNSCYGKFGQDGRNYETFIINEAGVPPDDELFKLYATKEDYWIFSKPDPVDTFYNVATAASVTAFVRAYLWESIQSCDGPLYCDTDSIICRNFGGAISKRLGDWDLEAEATEAYIAQRKMYAMKLRDGSEKVASKGVRLNYNQIKTGVETGQAIVTERDAPAFSLKYGARFFDRTTNFQDIQKNTCNNPN